MRTVILGATGHIGTYLVPRLVTAGHEVVAVSRGLREHIMIQKHGSPFSMSTSTAMQLSVMDRSALRSRRSRLMWSST